jgi:hypothetical protein
MARLQVKPQATYPAESRRIPSAQGAAGAQLARRTESSGGAQKSCSVASGRSWPGFDLLLPVEPLIVAIDDEQSSLRVAENHSDYLIVEKMGEAGDIAEQLHG